MTDIRERAEQIVADTLRTPHATSPALVASDVLDDLGSAGLSVVETWTTTITGAEAADLHVGSVVLYPDDPAALPVVRRPDGWFSTLYGDVNPLGRDATFVLGRRAPEPTQEQLTAVHDEIERGPEGATRRVRLRVASGGAR